VLKHAAFNIFKLYIFLCNPWLWIVAMPAYTVAWTFEVQINLCNLLLEARDVDL